jgi:hypothetical protein
VAKLFREKVCVCGGGGGAGGGVALMDGGQGEGQGVLQAEAQEVDVAQQAFVCMPVDMCAASALFYLMSSLVIVPAQRPVLFHNHTHPWPN